LGDETSFRYALVTPTKNEVNRLPKLINSMLLQNSKPIFWVFVDGKSTDGTISLLRRLQKDQEFVRVISNDEEINPDPDRYGAVVRKGFDFVARLCEEKSLALDYIALVDSDVILGKDYFEKLIHAFMCDSRLGLASGAIFEQSDKRLLLRRNLSNELFCASAMMFRMECYEAIGGFPTILGPEIVAVAKAIHRGWNVMGIPNAVAIHTRPSASRRGIWNGFKKCGETFYKLNYHPINAVLTGIYFTLSAQCPFSGPSIAGPAYLYGYIMSAVCRKRKVSDPEVMNYFWNSWKRLVARVHLKIRKLYSL